MPLDIGGPSISVTTAGAASTFTNASLASTLSDPAIDALQIMSIPPITISTSAVTTLYILGLLETLAGNYNCPATPQFPTVGQRFFNYGYFL